MTVLIVIAILVLLIVTHEFGHFIFAKLFKVKVEEFGIGYPPRAFLFGKIGDTEYTFNWIPFGGFVRLFGEDDTESKSRGSFSGAKKWQQAVILVAGVLANALTAYLLFAWAFTLGVPRIVDTPVSDPNAQLLVSDVVPGSPADAAGLIAGDRIVGVETPGGDDVKELSPDGVKDFVRERGGVPILVTYERARASSTVTVRPANAVVPGAAGRPAMGVGLVMVANESLSWGDALVEAFYTTGNAFKYVGNSLWTMVRDTAVGAPDLSQVVGPVGLVSVIGDASHNGAGYVIELAAFIAVNLAIINLIPIPALDGGRLLVLLIDAILKKPAPRLAIQLLNTIGIALIILLMITVTYNDVIRLFI